MFAVYHRLGLDQLLIEAAKRQLRGQYRVLDVK